MNKFSDYFYVPKEDLPREYVVENLRLYGRGRDDALLPKDSWREDDQYWLLPRGFGLENFEGVDNTVCPERYWNAKSDFSPRHDQKRVITELQDKLENNLSVRLEAPTGYGKTYTSLQTISKFNTNVIVVAAKDDLLNQWTESYNALFEGDVCRIQGQKNEAGCGLTVATAQTLYQQRDSLEIWDDYGAVILDEGHNFSADTFFHVANKFTAKYRMAVSATWRRADGLIGLVEKCVSSDLVVGERTDNLEIKVFKKNLDYGHRIFQFIRRGRPDNNLALQALTECAEYIRDLSRLLEDLSKNYFPCCVFNRKAQMEKVHQLLEEKGIKVGIYAATYKGKKVKDHDKINDCQVILATTKKIKDGTDIPRMDCMVLADFMKDPEQCIGRALREYPGKTHGLVVDLRFPQMKIFNKSARERDKHYKRLGAIELDNI